MPTPNKGETEPDFLRRCIPIVMAEGAVEDTKQAAAICYSMYRERTKK